jgi:hypothetical protein
VASIQFSEDTPPEMRSAFERLISAGYTPQAAERLTGARWTAPSAGPAAAAAPRAVLTRELAPGVRGQRNLPVQGIVDRSVQLEVPMIDTLVRDGAGNVLIVLRNPVGGAYGRGPNDPAGFSGRVNPRVGMCQVLTGSARMRCALSRGYF